MSVTMDFQTFFQCVKTLPANISVLIRGDHGIGKSEGVFQLGKVWNLPVIDKRMSQMSEGDVIGLPKIEGGVTKFLPPDWYKEACDNPRIVFLDELNRATTEVMQAAFQIVLDRTLNGYRLHPETRVFAAINTSSSYQINEMDPALLDRFWVVDLKPTAEEWVEWAKENLHEHVVDFIRQNNRYLDPTHKIDPGTVEPSRRSWARLSRTLVQAGVAEEPENSLFYSLSRGFVGNEAAIAFTGFVKNIDNQISALNILNEFDKYEKKIKKLGQEKWNICIDKINDHLINNELVESQGPNLAKFVDVLPDELIVILWGILSKPGSARKEQIRIAHRAVIKHIMRIFNGSDASVMERVEKMNQDRLKAQEAKNSIALAAETDPAIAAATSAPVKKPRRKKATTAV